MVTYLAGCANCGTVNLIETRHYGPPKAAPIVHKWASMSRFIAAQCTLGHDVRTESTAFVAAYLTWCEARGVDPLPRQVIGNALGDLFGIERTRSNGMRYYRGVSLT